MLGMVKPFSMAQTNTLNQQIQFQSIPGDPLNVLHYTLPNGLKLFLSINKNEPRIFTNIVVRAGSKHDPADTTGLAHYMEHMLFKGTSKIGAVDWEKESVYLDKIAQLYEEHRATNDQEKRLEIYKEIDQLSYEAAKLVAPNEYDKLVSTIGGQHTNAYTWVEQTVYVNDIPSNELERWMLLEAERFRMMALRLFHTELETVYEEFNISQDQDLRKVNKAIRQVLFPSHPYGTQTTIGSAQHIKAPSQLKIQEFFKTYYIPNNMGIVLSGDFKPEEAVQLAHKYFGHYEASPIPPFSYPEQEPLSEPKHVDVYGLQAPFADIAWRIDGAGSRDAQIARLIKQIFYNQQAGLLDINLNQNQQVLSSQAWLWNYEDYGVFGLYAKLREGQSMREAEQLLLNQMELLKEGHFEEWLIEAAIKDMKLTDVKANEANRSRVAAIAQAFILGIDWQQYINRFNVWEQITKQDIVQFAQKHFGNNYVSIHKHQQEDKHIIKVDKPPITPVELKREAYSSFAEAFWAKTSKTLKPKFADFARQIHSQEIQKGLQFDYVFNPDNELFRLDYIFEIGKLHDLWLPIALRYLPYLGTNRYDAAALQQAFFRLGISFDLHAEDRRVYLTISGLDESLEEGLHLMEHLLEQLVPDSKPLERIITDIITRREHSKNDRAHILRKAMANYARYGVQSPYRYRLSEEELKKADADHLVSKIRGLTDYEHTIHYYGRRTRQEVAQLIEKYHRRAPHLQAPPPKANFVQQPTLHNEVLLVDFPMVQADVMMISRATPNFSLEESIMSELYNEYFGYGLSSIVFQEIRESKALAYSTFAYYSSPTYHHQAHYLQAYVGTQPDKLNDAIPAMRDIIEHMPIAEAQIEQARLSILRRIESEYVQPSRLYWEARTVKQLGYQHDLRADLYKKMEATNSKDLIDFHHRIIKGRKFKYLILGRQDNMDKNMLDNIGIVNCLSLEDVFGY
jgi:predicted Zn-dependent peptidase